MKAALVAVQPPRLRIRGGLKSRLTSALSGKSNSYLLQSSATTVQVTIKQFQESRILQFLLLGSRLSRLYFFPRPKVYWFHMNAFKNCPMLYCHCLAKFRCVSMETARSRLNTTDCQDSCLTSILENYFLGVKPVPFPGVAALLVTFNWTSIIRGLVFTSSARH